MKTVYLMISICFSLVFPLFAIEMPKEMKRAEQLMETCPDSAYIYLNTLTSFLAKQPEEVRMYYILLRTRAEDKLYQTPRSDSLIQQAVQYYEQKGNREHLQYAYYLLGRVYCLMDDYPRSLIAFLKAVDMGQGNQSPRRFQLLGYTHEQINYFFAYHGLYEQALQHIKDAYNNYGLAKDTIGIAVALRNKARIFDVQHEVDSMECYYKMAYQTACSIRDSLWSTYILDELISAYMDHGLIERGETLIDSLPLEYKMNNAISLYSIGMVHRFHHRSDSMRLYFQKALPEASPSLRYSIYKMLAQDDSLHGNYADAYCHALLSLTLQDSIMAADKSRSIQNAQFNYDYDKLNRQKIQLQLKNEQHRNWIYLLIIICGAGIFLCHRLYQLSKRLKQRMKEERRQTELSIIVLRKEQQAELESITQKINRLQEELLETQQTKERLICQYKQQIERERHERHLHSYQGNKSPYEAEMSIIRDSDIYRRLHQTTESLPDNASEWDELKTLLDDHLNLTAKLTRLLPNISETELRVCRLYKIDLRPKDIARLIHLSATSVSHIKSRFFEKVTGKKSSAKDFDSFISDL